MVNTTQLTQAVQSNSVPDVDILTLLFDTNTDPNSKLHISASNPTLALTTSRTRSLTEATSSALRRHFSIGAAGAGRDVVSVISHGHYLLPVLVYGIIAAGGVLAPASTSITATELSEQLISAQSRVLCCTEATKYVALNAAEEAGWGRNGGGRVLIMSETKNSLRAVRADFQLGRDILDEGMGMGMAWETIGEKEVLEGRVVAVVYGDGGEGIKLSQRDLVDLANIPGEGSKKGLMMERIEGIRNYIIAPFRRDGPVYWEKEEIKTVGIDRSAWQP